MFQFIPRQIPNRIFVIGCGGTGSRLVPLLAQFMRTVTHGVTPRGNVVNPTIYVIDDDVVESKNLLRQNFIESDVGKGKAEVLANRYSRAFGVNIIPSRTRVTRECSLTQELMLDYAGNNAMVIMCVDSAQARRDIISYWSGLDRASNSPSVSPFFIDAGNEDDFGQVRFFNLLSGVDDYRCAQLLGSIPKMTPERVALDYMPMDVNFYLDLQDNGGASCAELDQTLAINALMATMIMGVVQNFFYVKPFSYYSMGISLAGGVTTSLITPQYLTSITVTSARHGTLLRGRHNMISISQLLERYIELNLETLHAMGLDSLGQPFNNPAAASEEVGEPDDTEDEDAGGEFGVFDDFVEVPQTDRVAEAPVLRPQPARTAAAPMASPPPLVPVPRARAVAPADPSFALAS